MLAIKSLLLKQPVQTVADVLHVLHRGLHFTQLLASGLGKYPAKHVQPGGPEVFEKQLWQLVLVVIQVLHIAPHLAHVDTVSAYQPV